MILAAIQEVVVTEILQDSTTKTLNASTPAPLSEDATTTKASNGTDPVTTPEPEPEPENGAALTLFGWTTTLLLATITALLL